MPGVGWGAPSKTVPQGGGHGVAVRRCLYERAAVGRSLQGAHGSARLSRQVRGRVGGCSSRTPAHTDVLLPPVEVSVMCVFDTQPVAFVAAGCLYIPCRGAARMAGTGAKLAMGRAIMDHAGGTASGATAQAQAHAIILPGTPHQPSGLGRGSRSSWRSWQRGPRHAGGRPLLADSQHNTTT